MLNTDWIKDLKEGDKVYIDRSRFGETKLELSTVKKVTPKGFIRTDGGYLFRNGEYKIDSWTYWHLKQWTPELETKLKTEAHLKHMQYSINAMDMRTVAPEKVQKIYDILNDYR